MYIPRHCHENRAYKSTENKLKNAVGIRMGISSTQVPSTQYVSANYCSPARFSSYAYQIREVLDTGSRNVLEIGPGNGVVTQMLRAAGVSVTTLDHAPKLNPDVVGSVLDLPFELSSFDTVICCQVLEHLPFAKLQTAISEIRRVMRKAAVISLPDASIYTYIEFKLPKIRTVRIAISIPRVRAHRFDGEHYWEIGKGRRHSVHQILRVLKDSGLRINRQYRLRENPYHRFFVVST